MIISIDCRFFDASGVGVYLRGCLPFLLNAPHSFILMGDRKKIMPFTLNRRNVEILDCTVKPFSIREFIFFPRRFRKKINKTDLHYSPYFNVPAGITVPVYTTIHDIVFPDMPELTSPLGLAVRMWFYRRAFRLSKKIFTVSNFSKSRIEHFLGTAKPVIVTHGGADTFLPEQKTRDIQKKNTILFIGNIKKHKGIGCLLDAFFMARQEGLEHNLLIAGSRDNFRSADRELIAKIDAAESSALSFTGRIPGEDLAALLAEAALLVQPSLYEGFGIPPLEAMMSGTGALVSDIPALREIYAEFPVVFFRAGDSMDLKEKLMGLLHNKKPEPLRLSKELRQKYSFEKTASTILDSLR